MPVDINKMVCSFEALNMLHGARGAPLLYKRKTPQPQRTTVTSSEDSSNGNNTEVLKSHALPVMSKCHHMENREQRQNMLNEKEPTKMYLDINSNASSSSCSHPRTPFNRNIDEMLFSLLLLLYSGSSSSMIAIDNKIEQAMDLVKSHLMYAVREEVEVLREQIKELIDRNSLLERENSVLKSIASSDQLSQLQTQMKALTGTSGGPPPTSA